MSQKYLTHVFNFEILKSDVRALVYNSVIKKLTEPEWLFFVYEKFNFSIMITRKKKRKKLV